MIVYILEHEPNKALFTTDKTKCKGRIHLPYPQQERALTSDVFQWIYMEAFFQTENMQVEMDEDCWKIWNSRPAGFDDRHKQSECERVLEGNSKCENIYDCCDCGGNECGCAYCWSCNACDTCRNQ